MNYCLPINQTITIGTKLIKDILSADLLQDYFSDLYVAWKLVLAMAGVCLGVCIIYSLLMRYFAGFMVWLMIVLLLILMLVLGISTALLSQDVQFIKDLISYDTLPEPFKDKTYATVVSCICLCSFTIGLLVVCCMQKEIKVCKYNDIQL